MQKIGRVGLILIALVFSISLCGCKTSSLVSESDEIAVGRQAAKEIERDYKILDDPKLNNRINKIGQELAARSDRSHLEYSFKILDTKEINAIALPGGWVYIFKGLIDVVGNDQDQLAGVIAHEIGHISARHHASQMGRATLYEIGIQVLTKGNVSQWAAIWANLDLLRWNRAQEKEADRLAIKYTYGSNYDPQGLIDFLKYLQSKSGGGEKSPFGAMLRTHPLTEDRIKASEEYLNKLKEGNGSPSSPKTK